MEIPFLKRWKMVLIVLWRIYCEIINWFQIITVLEQSMDKFISIIIILVLLVGAVLMTFFVAVQVENYIY